MGKVTYVEFDGSKHTIDLDDGLSIMEGAVRNGIRGIDGDCGGQRACATCHVYVELEWLHTTGLPPEGSQEASMLSFAAVSQPNSRLACQIAMTPELDGLVVRLPEDQH